MPLTSRLLTLLTVLAATVPLSSAAGAAERAGERPTQTNCVHDESIVVGDTGLYDSPGGTLVGRIAPRALYSGSELATDPLGQSWILLELQDTGATVGWMRGDTQCFRLGSTIRF